MAGRVIVTAGTAVLDLSILLSWRGSQRRACTRLGSMVQQHRARSVTWRDGFFSQGAELPAIGA